MPTNVTQQLNTEQERAINTTEGPLLIIAGAGSGKTKVITHRILNLIKKGVAPHSILAITFTNKAAKEMRERVEKLLEEDKTLNLPISMRERPFVSTFHALGVHIIRENAGLLGLTRHFTIYDRSDSRRAIKEAMVQCSVDPKAFEPGTILNMISRAKGDGMGRSEYIDNAGERGGGKSRGKGGGLVEDTVVNVWEKYEAILSKEKSLDFDDLLLRTAQLLEKYPAVRAHYNALWKYIHIDEYQDTNRVQYKIARLLAEKKSSSEPKDDNSSDNVGPNICVVGDADQNIYSWRGATIENILNFEKDYPNAQVIALEMNYRSTKTIIAAANDIIEKNTVRKKKTLRTDNADGDKITIIASYSEDNEAQSIADEARRLIANGVSPREIAVLYRANFQSRALEESFIKKNIPYQLVGTRFFERKEVKDVLSYIRAALNWKIGADKGGTGGKTANEGGWGDIARIINVPARGIGKVTVAKILSGMENELPPAMKEKLSGFWKLLSDIRIEIAEKKPSEAVKFVIQETGMERMLRPRSDGGSGDAEDEERLLNVRELVSVAAQYDHLPIGAPQKADGVAEIATTENSDEVTGIEAFLANAALASDQDDLEKDKNAAKLMTVHASKGLEFEYVFVAGLEEDLFPFKHMDDADISLAEEEEERRLFYVAITRAKKKLYLSYTIIRTIYGAQRISTPSSFISDIDPELIDDHKPEKPSGAKAIFIDF
jgi:DNA helicase-2/ATP-dependent DNA helicase PcrA